MDVKNCRECGRLFNYMGGEPLCPACKDALEDKFEVVKEYIRSNPKVGIDQVSKECEVSLKQLKKWIRQERLTFSEDSPIMIDCEMCGAPIRSGKYCESCRLKIANGLEDAIRKPKKLEPVKKDRERDRMRFLDK